MICLHVWTASEILTTSFLVENSNKRPQLYILYKVRENLKAFSNFPPLLKNLGLYDLKNAEN